jgi:hypothetical protein
MFKRLYERFPVLVILYPVTVRYIVTGCYALFIELADEFVLVTGFLEFLFRLLQFRYGLVYPVVAFRLLLNNNTM